MIIVTGSIATACRSFINLYDIIFQLSLCSLLYNHDNRIDRHGLQVLKREASKQMGLISECADNCNRLFDESAALGKRVATIADEVGDVAALRAALEPRDTLCAALRRVAAESDEGKGTLRQVSLYRHRRRHVRCAALDVPVLETTASAGRPL